MRFLRRTASFSLDTRGSRALSPREWLGPFVEADGGGARRVTGRGSSAGAELVGGPGNLGGSGSCAVAVCAGKCFWGLTLLAGCRKETTLRGCESGGGGGGGARFCKPSNWSSDTRRASGRPRVRTSLSAGLTPCPWELKPPSVDACGDFRNAETPRLTTRNT